jgi:colicin import membrane protein
MKSTVKPKKSGPRVTDPEGDRKAALAFEKEQARREKQRRKEEAAREKERDRRQRLVEKTQEALDQAKRAHEERAAAIDAERDALEERSRTEDARWERERQRLEKGLRRARDSVKTWARMKKLPHTIAVADMIAVPRVLLSAQCKVLTTFWRAGA